MFCIELCLQNITINLSVWKSTAKHVLSFGNASGNILSVQRTVRVSECLWCFCIYFSFHADCFGEQPTLQHRLRHTTTSRYNCSLRLMYFYQTKDVLLTIGLLWNWNKYTQAHKSLWHFPKRKEEKTMYFMSFYIYFYLEMLGEIQKQSFKLVGKSMDHIHTCGGRDFVLQV